MYGGSGGGIYFRHNNNQKLKLEGGNFTYENGATVTHASHVYIPDSIIHVGDTNTKIRFPADDTFSVETAGSERLRIDSGGSVSIGDAATHAYSAHSEGDDLVVGGAGWRGMTIYGEGGGSVIQFADNADNRVGQILYNHGDNSMLFRVNGNVDRVIIDSSGRVLIGHTGTDDRDGYNSALQVSGTGGDDASVSIGRWSANSSYPALTLSKSRNGTIGSHTVLVADDYLGGIQFQGDDGSGYHVGASIVARVESGVGNNDMPASLRFNTNQGTTGTTERVKIHGGGNGHNILYGGRVDILGYQGLDIVGGTNSNVLNEQFLVCPSAASSYDDNHTITFGQTKGDWYQGTGSAYHTSFGLLWNFGGSGGSATREVRAGIHYDHRHTEKFKIWSSYGDIQFKVDSGQSGNETAETCNTTAMTITHDGHVIKPVQPRALVEISSTTTLGNSKITNWASPMFNVGSLWNAANSRFIAPVDGLYMIGGNFRIGAPGKIRVIKFNIQAYNTSGGHMATYGGGIGGSGNYDGGSGGYDHPYVSFTNVIYLTTGQYLELHCSETATEHTSYIQTNNNQSHMWCVLLQ